MGPVRRQVGDSIRVTRQYGEDQVLNEPGNPRLVRTQWRIGIEAAGLGNHQSLVVGHPNPRRHRCHRSQHPVEQRGSSDDAPQGFGGEQMTAGQDLPRATLEETQ